MLTAFLKREAIDTLLRSMLRNRDEWRMGSGEWNEWGQANGVSHHFLVSPPHAAPVQYHTF